MENGKQPTGKQAKEVYSDNPRYQLFKHLSDEYSLLLLDSELDEIINISNKISEQPTEKQVESECEAVEFLIEQSFKLGVQWGETYGGWFNPNKEDNERKLKECKETVKQLYQIFKTDNVEKF